MPPCILDGINILPQLTGHVPKIILGNKEVHYPFEMIQLLNSNIPQRSTCTRDMWDSKDNKEPWHIKS